MTLHDLGDRWDRGDVEALLSLLDEGRTQSEAAAALGRTRAAVASKLYRLRRAAERA